MNKSIIKDIDTTNITTTLVIYDFCLKQRKIFIIIQLM